MKRNLKFLLSAATVLVIMGFASMAFAQDGAAAQVANTKAGQGGWIALAAGIGLGLAALGGGLGQGRAAAAALDGIARNPGAAGKIQGPMILGLALIESLVLLSFVIAFFLQGFVSSP